MLLRCRSRSWGFCCFSSPHEEWTLSNSARPKTRGCSASYDPTRGRFISEDPLGFAAGDPNLIRRDDSLGLGLRQPDPVHRPRERRHRALLLPGPLLSDPKGGGEAFRPASADEGALLKALLSESFPGRDAMVKQVEDALVRPIDDDGSLEFSRA
jgi:hypothetical protein